MNWSPYQNDVYNAVANTTDNIMVEAVAGSGKSTTLKEAVRRIPERDSILVLAFNRHIRDPLKADLSDLPNVEVTTLNSFGFAAVRDGYAGRVKVDAEKTAKTLRYQCLDDDEESKIIFYSSVKAIKQIIGLRKSLMLWEPYTLWDMKKLYELVDQFDISLPTTLSEVELFRLLDAVWAKSILDQRVIDFDDQLAFPIYHNLRVEEYDYVLVDEAQDLSPVQIELTKRAISPNTGRAIYCGDRKQAIYQFRGADSAAIQRIEQELNCKTLPLSICYRCGSAIVDLAREIVPQIESPEGQHSGAVEYIYQDEFAPDNNSIVLCRTTAPLVEGCLKLIREGKKATVKGRDIGQSLTALVKKIKGPQADDPIRVFIDALEIYYFKEHSKLDSQRRTLAMQSLEDKFETLLALSHHVDRVGDLSLTIEKIFSDKMQLGVMFMTVHKAKGLEAEKVFIIRPDLMPHPKATNLEAEMNIRYVAITRAETVLTFVHPYDRPQEEEVPQ